MGSYTQYQSFQGPTDPLLRHSEIEGYQPVSRIGEIVINAFGAHTHAVQRSRSLAHTSDRRVFLCCAQSIRTSLRS